MCGCWLYVGDEMMKSHPCYISGYFQWTNQDSMEFRKAIQKTEPLPVVKWSYGAPINEQKPRGSYKWSSTYETKVAQLTRISHLSPANFPNSAACSLSVWVVVGERNSKESDKMPKDQRGKKTGVGQPVNCWRLVIFFRNCWVTCLRPRDFSVFWEVTLGGGSKWEVLQKNFWGRILDFWGAHK